MRLLLLTKILNSDPKDYWLVDELIVALADRGHSVDVIHFDLKNNLAENEWSHSDLVSIYTYPWVCKDANKHVKVFLAGWCFLRNHIAIRRRFRDQKYDLVINFSIAMFFFGFASWLRKRKQVWRSLVVIWDFFPVHQVEIGRLKRGFLSKFLYWMENRTVRENDSVALMSERNLEFSKKYHPNFVGDMFVMPIWRAEKYLVPSGPSPLPSKSKDDFRIVFGGQLAAGRGVEQIIEIATKYRKKLQQVEFVIIGDGPLYGTIIDRIHEGKIDNVKLLRRAPRASYLSLLAESDAGLVITVPDVSIPSFPSKTLDYIAMGLPVIAATEGSSDYGSYIESVGRFGLHSEVGDLERLVENIARLQSDSAMACSLGENGRRHFLENFEVNNIVEKIEDFCRSRSLS